MRERTSAYIAIALLSSLIGLSAWYSVQNELADIHYVPSENSPDFTGRNVALLRFDEEGLPSTRFEAVSVSHFSDERMFAIYPKTSFYSPNSPTLVATGDAAYSVDGGIVFTIKDNVRIVREATPTEPATVLETEVLQADTAKNVLSTDAFVRIVQGIQVTEGVGMRFDNAKQTIQFFSNVKSIFHPQHRTVNLLTP